MTAAEKVNNLFSRIESRNSVALEHIDKLFDEKSFVEIGSFNTEASVVTGYGTVGGKLVYTFCQEGPIDINHAKKIAEIYALAVKMGAPIVGIMDSDGVKLTDGTNIFEAYGMLFSTQSAASGVIPQISVVKGKCIGMSAFTPALSDFVFITGDGYEFMSSPATFKGLDGKSSTFDTIGGGLADAENGSADFFIKDKDECFKSIRKLISILPSNNLEIAFSADCIDDLNREDSSLNSLITDETSKIEIATVIKSVADNNEFIEIKKDYAKNILAGFICLNSATVGVIANNGMLDYNGVKKASSFVNLCDSFNIPILSLTDVLGYEKGSGQEKGNIITNTAKLIYAFSSATVPKVNLIIRNAVGSAYLVMNSKHIGADIAYAWCTATISYMDKDSAIDIMKINPETYDEQSDIYNIASKGYVDDIIIPAATRKRLIAAFEMLSSKRVEAIKRKHGSVEF